MKASMSPLTRGIFIKLAFLVFTFEGKDGCCMFHIVC